MAVVIASCVLLFYFFVYLETVNCLYESADDSSSWQNVSDHFLFAPVYIFINSGEQIVCPNQLMMAAVDKT